MKLTCAAAAFAFALSAWIQPAGLCADEPHLSARVFYRDDYTANSGKQEILLDDAPAQYIAVGNGAPGQNAQPQNPAAFVFRIRTTQPTQAVQWVSIPLAGVTSMDFQWLPLPRSTIGFRTVRIAMRDGGTNSIDVITDGQEYHYVRTGRSGVVEKDIKGQLELCLDHVESPAIGGFRSEVSYTLFAFRGIGAGKQRPHSPDNEWIINREFVDWVEFTVKAE